MHLEKNLDVQVVDQKGDPLKEWGQQKFGNNRLSCYVQSETGMSFGIRLVPTPHILNEMDLRRANIQQHRRMRPQDEEQPPEEPYHFLATLRLDGREAPEKLNIVYLHRNNIWFRKPDGKVNMGGKNIRESKHSDVTFHKWVFQEVGIESMIEELSLQLDNPAPEPEDPLIQAMEGLGANNLSDNEETAKTGVIEITIHRVHIADNTTQRPFDTTRSTQNPAGGRSKADRNISHTTGRDAGRKVSSNMCTFIAYDQIDPEDEPWAVFKFFYRSEDVLRKFDFRGFPKKQMRPDPMAMAKLGLGDGVSKRGTAELSYDSDSDDDNLVQRAIGGRKTRKANKTTEQDSPARAAFPDQGVFSDDDDVDEEKTERECEEDDRARGFAKAVFIDVDKQPLAGPKRAVFSKNEEHENSTFIQIAATNTANDLLTTKPDTAEEVVQQKPEESDEEL